MTYVPARSSVAYFSMEIALSNELPTYSGGLGVLAGDTLRSAADLELPLVAVTVNGPPAVLPAVNRPDVLMVPPPFTDQVNVGCGLIG